VAAADVGTNWRECADQNELEHILHQTRSKYCKIGRFVELRVEIVSVVVDDEVVDLHVRKRRDLFVDDVLERARPQNNEAPHEIDTRAG